MNKQQIKELLLESPKEILLSQISPDDVNRLRIITDGITFESFVRKPEKNSVFNGKLYICLSAVFHGYKKYPVFHRASWQELLGGILVCIDDPTRQDINHQVSTYFFGNKDLNYIDLVVKIARHFANIYSINYENIVFISNSNGGFAALNCANILQGSSAITFNPNINIELWSSHKKTEQKPHSKLFEEIFKVKFSDKALSNRFDVTSIISNQKSKFFLYFNKASSWDAEQLNYFCSKTGFEASLELQKKGNVFLYTNNVPAKDPHMAFPNENSIFFIEDILSKTEISEKDGRFFRLLSSYMFLYYGKDKQYNSLITDLNKLISS